MAIKILNYYLFSVPVNFEISRIHIPYSRHLIVEIMYNGKPGVGEGVSYRSSLSQIEKYLGNNTFDQEPGLVAALDQAKLDAEGAISHDLRHEYTRQVFIEEPGAMFLKTEKLIKNKCRQIKLKLGRNPNNDIYLINKLQKCFPEIEFKADVNGGYELSEFEKVINQTGNYIKIWEEPVAKNNLRLLEKLKRKYGLKIMLDENVKTLAELEFYIKQNIIDIINIKLSRLGGVTVAKKYIALCQQYQILISIGCSEELGVGMQATNYLAAQVPHLFGIEGEGCERLGFDIVNRGDFNLEKLQQAARKFGFKIFSRTNQMSFFDKINENKENMQAKFQNLRVRLCH